MYMFFIFFIFAIITLKYKKIQKHTKWEGEQKRVNGDYLNQYT